MFRNLFPAQPDMAGLLQSMPKGQQTSQPNPVNMLGALSQLTQLPSMPKPPEFRGSGNVSLGGGRPDPAAARSAEQQKEQAGLQAGLSELGKLKTESGKPTLTLDQMIGTLAKNMPAERATQIGRLMFNEQQALVDKNKLSTVYEKIDQGGKLTAEEKALVGYKEDKKEKPKNKVVDYFMPDKQGGYTKESVQISEDAYNDTIKQIRSSGGFLRDRTEKKEKPQANVDEYGRTPKDRLMHNKNRMEYFNTNFTPDSEDEMTFIEQRLQSDKVAKKDIPSFTKKYKSEYKALAKKQSDTEYDAGIYGWNPTRIKNDTTGEVVEVYKTPKGIVDLYGDKFNPAKPAKPKETVIEPPPKKTKEDITKGKPEAEKVLSPKEKQMSQAANKSPYLRTAAEQKVLQEASNQEIKNVLSTLPGIAEKITGTIYKGITPRKEDTAYLKRLWDMLLQGQKESREALGR